MCDIAPFLSRMSQSFWVMDSSMAKRASEAVRDGRACLATALYLAEIYSLTACGYRLFNASCAFCF